MKHSAVTPIDDKDVPKIDDAVAVGEDLAFQERWWKFERIVWIFFLFILLADVAGLFGRGWLAKAEAGEPQAGMQIKYERVERASTPSIMTLQFAPEAIVNGQIHLFVNTALVKELGAQRIIPQPEHSAVGNNGITYTFAASGVPATIQFQLEPSFPGIHNWTMQVENKAPISGRVVVVP